MTDQEREQAIREQTAKIIVMIGEFDCRRQKQFRRNLSATVLGLITGQILAFILYWIIN